MKYFNNIWQPQVWLCLVFSGQLCFSSSSTESDGGTETLLEMQYTWLDWTQNSINETCKILPLSHPLACLLAFIFFAAIFGSLRASKYSHLRIMSWPMSSFYFVLIFVLVFFIPSVLYCTYTHSPCHVPLVSATSYTHTWPHPAHRGPHSSTPGCS